MNLLYSLMCLKFETKQGFPNTQIIINNYKISQIYYKIHNSNIKYQVFTTLLIITKQLQNITNLLYILPLQHLQALTFSAPESPHIFQHWASSTSHIQYNQNFIYQIVQYHN